MEVKRGGIRMGKERMVELQDAEMSDRVANLESPAPLQLDALFETVALGHFGVVVDLSLFPSALPRLPPPPEL